VDQLVNAIKIQASRLDSQIGSAKFGTVTSVDVNNAAVKVMMQPDGVLSGWLPVLSPWIGSGWGMVCLPGPGDQVLVVPQEGASEHSVVVGGAFSNARRPPQAPIGELWLVHQSGASLKLLNDGTVRVTGDLRVDGDIYDRRGSLAHFRNAYDNHVHMDSRPGLTSVPTVLE
jgi:phage baseplate assembly protein V